MSTSTKTKFSSLAEEVANVVIVDQRINTAKSWLEVAKTEQDYDAKCTAIKQAVLVLCGQLDITLNISE